MIAIMRVLTLTLLLLSTLTSAIPDDSITTDATDKTAASSSSSNLPLELTSTNIASFISALPPTGSLIMFYAPYCTHCKKFRPTFDLIANELPPDSSAKVNAIEQETLARKYSVDSYPSILWIAANNGDRFVKFDDDAKTKAVLIDWYNARTLPSVTPIDANKPGTLDSFHKSAVVTVLLNSQNKKIIDKYNFLAEDFSDPLIKAGTTVKFGLIDKVASMSDAEVTRGEDGSDGGLNLVSCANCIKVTVRTASKIRMCSNNDWCISTRSTQFPISSHSQSTVLSMKKKLVGFIFANVDEKRKGFQLYEKGMLDRMQKGSVIKKAALVIVHAAAVDQLFGNVLNETARTFSSEVAQFFVDPVEYHNVVSRYNVDSFPSVLLMDVSGKAGSIVTKIIKPVQAGSAAAAAGNFSSVFAPENIAEHYYECLLGKGKGNQCRLPPRAGSEKPIKSHSLSRPFKTLVGKTFNGKILASNTDNVVLFHNGIDQLTNMVKEEIYQFATRFYAQDSVDFYEINIALNDVPMKSVEIISAPAIYFFAADDREKVQPTVFRGSNFKAEELINWFAECVTIPFTGYIDGLDYGNTYSVFMRYHLRKFIELGVFDYYKLVKTGDETTAKIDAASEVNKIERERREAEKEDKRIEEVKEGWRKKEEEEEVERAATKAVLVGEL